LIEGEVNELDAAENEARIENELRALKVFPYLQEHQELKCEECLSEQHFTQPPRRFRESTLIKELEERGIGRPSTYASILSVIQEKNYTEKQESRFVPTELGFLVTDLLISHFPNIIDVEFTAKMEESLDQIEIGQQEWIGLLREFYTPFEQTLALAKEEMRNIKRDGQETNIDCDLCNAKMVIKWGRNGQFLACSNYPTCKNTKDFYRNERGEIAVKEPLADSEQAFGNCPVCEATVVLKMGKFGRFLACSNYPECKTTMPFRLGLPCPQTDCNGEIVEKRSRKAKIFYSCSNYPTCTYAVWDKPIPEICPTCEHPFLLEATKKHKNRPAGIYCPQCNYYRGEK
jgi:DNA topoisomerase-1